MINDVENMIKDLPMKLKSTDIAKTPAGKGLFNQSGNLPTESAEAFHTTVAEGLFQCMNAQDQIYSPWLLLYVQGWKVQMKLNGVNLSDWRSISAVLRR